MAQNFPGFELHSTWPFFHPTKMSWKLHRCPVPRITGCTRYHPQSEFTDQLRRQTYSLILKTQCKSGHKRHKQALWSLWIQYAKGAEGSATLLGQWGNDSQRSKFLSWVLGSQFIGHLWAWGGWARSRTNGQYVQRQRPGTDGMHLCDIHKLVWVETWLSLGQGGLVERWSDGLTGLLLTILTSPACGL